MEWHQFVEKVAKIAGLEQSTVETLKPLLIRTHMHK